MALVLCSFGIPECANKHFSVSRSGFCTFSWVPFCLFALCHPYMFVSVLCCCVVLCSALLCCVMLCYVVLCSFHPWQAPMKSSSAKMMLYLL